MMSLKTVNIGCFVSSPIDFTELKTFAAGAGGETYSDSD